MEVKFLSGRVALHSGDCREVLATLDENSLDACVCDPPYHLTSIVKRFGGENSAPAQFGSDGRYARASAGFMGKVWDGGDIAFRPETWAVVYRVLKPGAHMLVFGGTRTFHRLACAIEDAGFEIRDTISWNFGSGFPKSHNISKTLDDKKERCICPAHLRSVQHDLGPSQSFSSGTQQDMQSNMLGNIDGQRQHGNEGFSLDSVRDLREVSSSSAIATPPDGSNLLQQLLSEQNFCRETETVCFEREVQAASGKGIEGRKESGMEGRRDVPPSARELRERSLRKMSAGFDFDGESGRLCDGASLSDGAVGETTIDANGMRASSRPPTIEQHSEQSGTVAGQSQPQERRAWPRCGRCCKPIVPDGLGTALKPAMELICVARKPLSEGTVAGNVLRWGTGAINISGCRVAMSEDDRAMLNAKASKNPQDHTSPIYGEFGKGIATPANGQGRWPANLVHDGSDEVVAGFPESKSSGGSGIASQDFTSENGIYGEFAPKQRANAGGLGDEGSAARFFYTAKADADDRLGSKHPTVKPLDLMQWLCRLVCPKGGTVLDPFAGTGTTGEAAFREGMHAVLIEAEAEYQADIRRRMALVLAGPDERSRESIKAKGLPRDDGPLFAFTQLSSRNGT